MIQPLHRVRPFHFKQTNIPYVPMNSRSWLADGLQRFDLVGGACAAWNNNKTKIISRDLALGSRGCV